MRLTGHRRRSRGQKPATRRFCLERPASTQERRTKPRTARIKTSRLGHSGRVAVTPPDPPPPSGPAGGLRPGTPASGDRAPGRRRVTALAHRRLRGGGRRRRRAHHRAGRGGPGPGTRARRHPHRLGRRGLRAHRRSPGTARAAEHRRRADQPGHAVRAGALDRPLGRDRNRAPARQRGAAPGLPVCRAQPVHRAPAARGPAALRDRAAPAVRSRDRDRPGGPAADQRAERGHQRDRAALTEPGGVDHVRAPERLVRVPARAGRTDARLRAGRPAPASHCPLPGQPAGHLGVCPRGHPAGQPRGPDDHRPDRLRRTRTAPHAEPRPAPES